MTADEEYIRHLNYGEGATGQTAPPVSTVEVESTALGRSKPVAPLFEAQRKALNQKLAEIIARGRGQKLTVERVADEHDQAMLLAQNDTQAMLLDSEGALMRLIVAALDRIDSGEYGRCEECDGKIPVKRLDAVPWAPRCVRCQEEHERREKAGRSAGVFAGDEE